MNELLRTRVLRFGFLPLLALLLLLAVTGYAAAQTPTPGSSGDKMGPHGMMIPELQGIPPDQLFDHFRGSQFTLTDAHGNVVIYQMTAGIVTAVTATGVTVTPNGANTPASFNITANTIVRGTPAAGSLQAVAQGDKVVVLSKQGSSDAVSIMKHSGGFHHGGMMMGS